MSLIEKLEQATEGSNDLDREIMELVGGRSFCSESIATKWDGLTATHTMAPVSFCAYSQSIDAALTLVPEGMEWVISNRGQIGAEDKAFAGVFGEPFVGSECDTNAATPALALCIAALKAREA